MRDDAVTDIQHVNGRACVVVWLDAFVSVNILHHCFKGLVIIVLAGRVDSILILDRAALITLKLIAQPLKHILALEDEEIKNI